MTPSHRTPQQRDRRFARIRRLTQIVFVGSGVASAVLVGYVASAAKPPVTVPVTLPTTTVPAATPTTTAPGHPTPTTAYRAPVVAPVTTTTICYSTPSGHVTCY
jgi:phosphoribosylcarboxyaminoimidazole (NCAIR) mutase